MRNWLGLAGDTNETDRLARACRLLYLITIPTTGAWYAIGSSLLGSDGATLAGLQASRGTLELAIILGAIGQGPLSARSGP